MLETHKFPFVLADCLEIQLKVVLHLNGSVTILMCNYLTVTCIHVSGTVFNEISSFSDSFSNFLNIFSTVYPFKELSGKDRMVSFLFAAFLTLAGGPTSLLPSSDTVQPPDAICALHCHYGVEHQLRVR